MPNAIPKLRQTNKIKFLLKRKVRLSVRQADFSLGLFDSPFLED
jgi:hypothetical protein